MTIKYINSALIHICIFICMMFLSSCGFKPIFGHKDGDLNSRLSNKSSEKNTYIIDELSKIDIETAELIEGVTLSKNLSELLNSKIYGEKKYLLKITLSFDTQETVISKKSDIIRQTKYVNVEYKLVDNMSNSVILESSMKKSMPYGSNFEPYNIHVINENVGHIIVNQVAREIYYALVFFFGKNYNA